jgi:Beta-glucosidase-related glycosidases
MRVIHGCFWRQRLWPLSFALFCCLLVFASGCATGTTATGHATSVQSALASPAPSATAIATAQPTPTPVPTVSAAAKRQMRVQQILQGMSQDDKLAQLIVVEFIGSDYVGSGLQQMVGQQHVGGFLYQVINNNFTAPNDSVAAAHAFSAQATADSKIAPLIAIDEEGGLVSKTSGFFGPTPSALDLAQSNDPQKAQQQAEVDAGHLKQLGINVDFAPVVDVGPASNLLVTRTFSSDPGVVSTYAGAFLHGLQQKGIMGTFKHFPGLGSLSQADDPHDALPHVTQSLHDLTATDFVPYKNLLQRDQPAMVMTTDVVTEALDPTQAAELSPKVLHYLRTTLGFNGVVITDGLYMRGLYNGQDPTNDQLAQVAVQAIEAGNDIVEGPYTPDSVSKVIAALKVALQQKKLSQAQVDQSVSRILTMKLQYGLLH